MPRARTPANANAPAPANAPANVPVHAPVLWLILLLTAALKLLLALAVDAHAPVLDERAYLEIAERLAAEGRFTGTFRPPLYPAFMAFFLAVGWGTLGIRLAQVVLSTASVVLVYVIGARAFGRRAGLIAAALFAFDPVLVAFSHRLWSETLFIFLLLATIERLLAAVRGRRLAPWIAAGLLLGLAGLTRPMILTFAPWLLPWAALQAWRQARAGRTAAGDVPPRAWSSTARGFVALTVACVMVVVPWTLRNYRESGGFILVDTNGAFNLLVASQPEAAFVDKDDLWDERFGRVDGRRYETYVLEEPARAQALATAAARDNIRAAPGRFLRKSLWEATHLWTLDSFLLRHLRNGWYGELPRGTIPLATLLAAGFAAALTLAAFLGLATTPAGPLRGLTLLLLLHSTLLFGLTYSLSRYALPLHAVLVLFAGVALSRPRDTRARLRRAVLGRLRAATLLFALAGLGVAWVRDLPLLADMVLDDGASHRFRMRRLPANAPANVNVDAPANVNANANVNVPVNVHANAPVSVPS